MFNKDLLFAKKGNAIVSKGGRKLYRHESGMGTVMEFNDGQDRKVLVLDAQYRARKLKMTSSTKDTKLPNYPTSNTNGTLYIDGGSSATTPRDCASLTDATLNSLWVNSIDANTSKYNTDVWLTQPDCACATHCRSIKVNGIGCDIPNFQTLLRIYCEGVLLDELDPTASSYRDLKLFNWFGFELLWSSTEYDADYIRRLDYDGYCSNRGFRNSERGVCPVLEI